MTDSSEMDTARFGFRQNLPGISIHRFSHRAMATIFEIFCVHTDQEYARQAAEAAFDLVDRLEQELSRFIGNSDIARIGRLKPSDSARVTRWTMECLQISQFACAETLGAFDISLGAGLNCLELAPGDCTVHAKADGIRLDLGGLGKGYAVDRIAEVMLDWEITQCLIHGGFSSVLALDAPSGGEGWPLTMSFPDARGAFALIQAKQRVFSASGVRKGQHILDPRTGRAARVRAGAWVSGDKDIVAGFCRKAEDIGEQQAPISASAAAVAEAFSTAFMVLDDTEVEECCRTHPGLEAWLLQGDKRAVAHLPKPPLPVSGVAGRRRWLLRLPFFGRGN